MCYPHLHLLNITPITFWISINQSICQLKVKIWVAARKMVTWEHPVELSEILKEWVSLAHLCWFALLHVWFKFSSTLFDLSVRLGCFFPVVFLLGVATSGPDNMPGDSLIFDLWPSPDVFWLSLALAFSLLGLHKELCLFSFNVWDGFFPTNCSSIC